MAVETADALQQAGLRVTRQRVAVLAALGDRPDAVTAQDLYAQLRGDQGSIGLTTVYRTLTSLAEAGFLDTFERSGEQAFRLCSGVHHHHLVCEVCNRVVELEAEPVEEWVATAAGHHGFTVTGHRVDIFGVCAACA